MDVSPIDMPTYDEMRYNVGDEFTAELVETFLEEAPGMLAQLRAALADRDGDSYRRAAHSLKSNCSTFGALELAALARHVELSGFGDDPASDAATLDALEAGLAAAAAALTELTNG